MTLDDSWWLLMTLDDKWYEQTNERTTLTLESLRDWKTGIVVMILWIIIIRYNVDVDDHDFLKYWMLYWVERRNRTATYLHSNSRDRLQLKNISLEEGSSTQIWPQLYPWWPQYRDQLIPIQSLDTWLFQELKNAQCPDTFKSLGGTAGGDVYISSVHVMPKNMHHIVVYNRTNTVLIMKMQVCIDYISYSDPTNIICCRHSMVSSIPVTYKEGKKLVVVIGLESHLTAIAAVTLKAELGLGKRNVKFFE